MEETSPKTNNYESRPQVHVEGLWGDGLAKTEEIFLRRVNLLLNKLSHSNFFDLREQIQTLCLESNEQNITKVAFLIVERALREPLYCPLYCALCSFLSTQLRHFRREFLNRIQQEFQSLKVPKYVASPTMTEQEIFEIHCKNKTRCMCVVRFIGELFLHGLISLKIIEFSLTTLFDPNCEHVDVQGLEFACLLLKLTGRELSQKNNPFLRNYLTGLENVVALGVQPRTVFMIQDVFDLRDCGWVKRKNTNGNTKVGLPKAL
eukprot:TRINITY_DN13018_c0_g1_i1.p1 TRINITY_DN13018_c0_g1~~TRINITY_DN13018_c0_g1_i1.p1  ORF type:complete len:283 (-),score=49.64 TRINITY_DN13018_c0_g1_i1:48-833(-)